jgi:protein-L-isoaspartate(D-aspartate) O-methyltransferase
MLPFAPKHLPEGFRSERVLDAIERVPRDRFVPEPMREDAARDIALPIGFGQTISQPFIVAYMTAGLNAHPGSRILEVGTGSGYQTAVLAALGLEVFTIELIPELSERAKKALEELGLAERVHFKVGDGWHGWLSEMPFDGIICTAAPARMPPALLEQVRVGGRLVIPSVRAIDTTSTCSSATRPASTRSGAWMSGSCRWSVPGWMLNGGTQRVLCRGRSWSARSSRPL